MKIIVEVEIPFSPANDFLLPTQRFFRNEFKSKKEAKTWIKELPSVMWDGKLLKSEMVFKIIEKNDR